MKNDLTKPGGTNFLDAINSFVQNSGLQNVDIHSNTRTGTASISGERDGFRYTTTVQQEGLGSIQTNSVFKTNPGSAALASQIKDLRRQGYKQQDIANMLGVSQSLVSRYLNR